MERLKLSQVQLEQVGKGTGKKMNLTDYVKGLDRKTISSASSSSSHFNLTKGGGRHGLGVDGWLGVGGGEVWPGVVPALVIVVLDVEAGELGEAYPQGAAGVVDVLSVQRLHTHKYRWRETICRLQTSRQVK